MEEFIIRFIYFIVGIAFGYWWCYVALNQGG